MNDFNWSMLHILWFIMKSSEKSCSEQRKEALTKYGPGNDLLINNGVEK